MKFSMWSPSVQIHCPRWHYGSVGLDFASSVKTASKMTYVLIEAALEDIMLVDIAITD